MKYLFSILLSFCLLSFGQATCESFCDRNFDQDHIMTTSYGILILSSFEDEDHITAYSEFGTYLWDVRFNAKVISWKLYDGCLFVFSKSRYLEKTYLTCINPSSGYIVWERP